MAPPTGITSLPTIARSGNCIPWTQNRTAPVKISPKPHYSAGPTAEINDRWSPSYQHARPVDGERRSEPGRLLRG